MPTFTLQKLGEIAHDVIGGRKQPVLTPEMSAKDVPGWDSLNHTLIVIEISELLGTELSAREAANFSTFGELVGFVNEKAVKLD